MRAASSACGSSRTRTTRCARRWAARSAGTRSRPRTPPSRSTSRRSSTCGSTPSPGASASSADTAALRFLRTRGHQPAFERAVKAYSKLGEHGAVWLAISGAGAALDGDRRGAWLRAGATVAASFVANQAVKLAVRRPRPSLPDLPPLIETMSNRSYPSAHATTCGAAAVAFRGLLPVAPLQAVAVSMTITRPYLGVHYPSDSVAGYALGVAVGKLAAP